MDERQFDRVARQFAAGLVRREVVRGLVGSAFGGALALLGWREAGADPKYRDPWIYLGEAGCNKNKLCYPDMYQTVTCYHGHCCYPGPGLGYGCNPLVSPNPSCCTGVCDPNTNQCTSV